MPDSRRHQPEPAYTIQQATEATLQHLNDQWGTRPGPSTGSLRAWDGTMFTISVTDTGAVCVRNDQLGDTRTLDVTTETDIDTLARAIADVIPHLY